VAIGVHMYVHGTVRMPSLAEPEVVDIVQCHQRSSAHKSRTQRVNSLERTGSIEKLEARFAEVYTCTRERSHVVRERESMILFGK